MCFLRGNISASLPCLLDCIASQNSVLCSLSFISLPVSLFISVVRQHWCGQQDRAEPEGHDFVLSFFYSPPYPPLKNLFCGRSQEWKEIKSSLSSLRVEGDVLVSWVSLPVEKKPDVPPTLTWTYLGHF